VRIDLPVRPRQRSVLLVPVFAVLLNLLLFVLPAVIETPSKAALNPPGSSQRLLPAVQNRAKLRGADRTRP
jgi:hypothetical protein